LGLEIDIYKIAKRTTAIRKLCVCVWVCVGGGDSPLDDSLRQLWLPLAAATSSVALPDSLGSSIARLCGMNQSVSPCTTSNNHETHFIDDEALLLMVKFSASDASELSRSPVNTLPGCGCTAPGIIGCCVACNEPVVDVVFVTAAPDDPTGFSTSPKGSKPFGFVCLFVCVFQ